MEINLTYAPFIIDEDTLFIIIYHKNINIGQMACGFKGNAGLLKE
ncbi:hypothetical protein GGU45_002824 [Niabella hirudinis]